MRASSTRAAQALRKLDPGPAAGLVLFAALAVVVSVAALAALGVPPAAPRALAAGVAGLVLLAIALAWQNREAAAEARAPSRVSERTAVDDRLAARLEEIKDAHWQISENEVRLRAVLDAQQEIVLRRDAEDRLTLVNSAFTRTFGVAAHDVLGTSFAPEVLASEAAAAPGMPVQRRVELIATAEGPRWIDWSLQRIAGATGEEMQATGRDVTFAREADLALKEARDQAEEASRAKSRFLAAVSHEIRTPMNGILGMASLLVETPLAPDQQTYVRAIDQSARNLLGLIGEILDFSKIEAGKLVLRPAPFSLVETVQAVVELMAPGAEEKGLEMAWEVAPSLTGTLLGDAARVRQILLNLVSNAVKFTDRGGVLVRVGERPAEAGPGGCPIRISVEDTGIGLSAADRARVFLEFEQAESALHRRHGGTGLGLAISMGLARAMNGAVSLESEVGAGSTFHADIVLGRIAEPEERAPIAHEEAARLKVLLVCDRPIGRDTLMRLLTGNGIRATAADPEEAARAIETAVAAGDPFNRLIVECELGPFVAGELLAALRSRCSGDPSAGDPPAVRPRGIVLISLLARASLAAFRARGFDSYLIRPVRPPSLMEQLGLRGLQRAAPSLVGGKSACANSAPSALAPGRRARVLLAEDNAINALLATRTLESAGCEVVVVSDGTSAVAAVEAAAAQGSMFDLILMDIHMPKLDGIAATRRLLEFLAKGPHHGPLPPVIALTANAFVEDREAYLAAGMSDYLAKPFDAQDLRRLLGRWLPQERAGVSAAPAA